MFRVDSNDSNTTQSLYNIVGMDFHQSPSPPSKQQFNSAILVPNISRKYNMHRAVQAPYFTHLQKLSYNFECTLVNAVHMAES